MKLGNIVYKGNECFACYITSDYEVFDDLRLAKKHARRLDNDNIKYIIYDLQGNPIKSKIVG